MKKNETPDKKIKMKETKKSVGDKPPDEPITSRFSSFFDEFKENVTEGAKVLKNLSGDLIDDVKEKSEDLYGKGSEKFEQASAVVESYIDQFKNEKEVKQLSNEKTELNAILGEGIYHEFKKNGTISKRYLTTKKMEELFNSIQSIDRQILKLGKELDKKRS